MLMTYLGPKTYTVNPAVHLATGLSTEPEIWVNNLGRWRNLELAIVTHFLYRACFVLAL